MYNITTVLLKVIEDKEKAISSLTTQFNVLQSNYSAMEDRYVKYKSEQLKNRIQLNNTSPEHLKNLEIKIKSQSTLIQRLLKPNKHRLYMLRKSFKFLPCDAIMMYTSLCKYLRRHANKVLSNPKYWIDTFTKGFPAQRSLYWMLYFHYHLSENVDKETNPLDKKDGAKNDYDITYFEIEMNTVNLSSFIGTDLFPDANAEQSADFMRISKVVINMFRVSDYWLYKHGLFYFIAIISKCLNSREKLIIKLIEELRKEPYLIDKLYSDDYYLVNLIVFKIMQIMKERLCEYYYHIKGVGFQLNKILINWVLSMFCDKV